MEADATSPRSPCFTVVIAIVVDIWFGIRDLANICGEGVVW